MLNDWVDSVDYFCFTHCDRTFGCDEQGSCQQCELLYGIRAEQYGRVLSLFCAGRGLDRGSYRSRYQWGGLPGLLDADTDKGESMSLKKTIELKTILTALLISFMSVLLLGVIMNSAYTQHALGYTLLDMNQEMTQSANAVTSVVTYFRGLDTLGEVTILFLSIFGIGIGIERSDRMKTIFGYDNTLLKIGTKVLFPLIVLFGLYIIVHGHLSPGGGFQGGVIIASGFLLMFLAYGDSYDLNHKVLALFEALSGAGFAVIGILGVLAGGLFLSNILPLGIVGKLFSAGILPIIYIFVGLKVAAEITVLVEYFIRTQDARDA